MTTTTPHTIVIVGGGVIGCSVLYRLVDRLRRLDEDEQKEGAFNYRIVLLESESLACSASGKAGGFLARDWCEGTPSDALARASFDLHAEYALKEEEEADEAAERVRLGYRAALGYRPIAAISAAYGGKEDATTSSSLSSTMSYGQWVEAPQKELIGLGNSASPTAQIDPALLTRSLVRRALRRAGGERNTSSARGDEPVSPNGEGSMHISVEILENSRVVRCERQQEESPSSAGSSSTCPLYKVTYTRTENTQEDDDRTTTTIANVNVVVLAMGFWTAGARSWMPSLESALPPMTGSAVTSIVLQREGEPSECPQAKSEKQDNEFDCTVSITGIPAVGADPEVYPRPNGDIYICGNAEPSGLRITSFSPSSSSNPSVQPPLFASQIQANPVFVQRLRETACMVSSRFLSLLDHVPSPAPGVAESATALETAMASPKSPTPNGERWKVSRTQACIVPYAERCHNIPLIGPVPDAADGTSHEGMFVATGHNFWGILTSHATGKALAEMILPKSQEHQESRTSSSSASSSFCDKIEAANFSPQRLRERWGVGPSTW